MRIASSKGLLILRLAVYLLFVAIAGWWFWDNYSAGHINWYMLFLGLSLLVQAIVGTREIDLVAGIVLSLLSCYMLLAVSSDLVDHFNGSKPVGNLLLYFGTGYSVFGASLIASILLIYIYSWRKRADMSGRR